MICPQQCVCKSAHRMDLSISRWVHAIETRQKQQQQQQQRGHDFMDASSESGPSGNEVKIELQIIKRLRVPFKAEHTRYTYYVFFWLFFSSLLFCYPRRFIQRTNFFAGLYAYVLRLGHIEWWNFTARQRVIEICHVPPVRECWAARSYRFAAARCRGAGDYVGREPEEYVRWVGSPFVKNFNLFSPSYRRRRLISRVTMTMTRPHRLIQDH